jgi:hypothetical protein
MNRPQTHRKAPPRLYRGSALTPLARKPEEVLAALSVVLVPILLILVGPLLDASY